MNLHQFEGTFTNNAMEINFFSVLPPMLAEEARIRQKRKMVFRETLGREHKSKLHRAGQRETQGTQRGSAGRTWVRSSSRATPGAPYLFEKEHFIPVTRWEYFSLEKVLGAFV